MPVLYETESLSPPSDKPQEHLGRIFSRHIKEKCWEKAGIVPGRDPKRWRVDPAGNIVNYKLRGCDGCLCHEYDHILPFSKGGQSTLQNCQILQTRPNRMKGNEDNDNEKLAGYSCAKKWTQGELDLMEMALYGGVNRDGLECRNWSNMEMFSVFKSIAYEKTSQKPKLPDCPN